MDTRDNDLEVVRHKESLIQRIIGNIIVGIPLWCLLFGFFLPEIRKLVHYLLGLLGG